jgi:hypothetical protein
MATVKKITATQWIKVLHFIPEKTPNSPNKPAGESPKFVAYSRRSFELALELLRILTAFNARRCY